MSRCGICDELPESCVCEAEFERMDQASRQLGLEHTSRAHRVILRVLVQQGQILASRKRIKKDLRIIEQGECSDRNRKAMKRSMEKFDRAYAELAKS